MATIQNQNECWFIFQNDRLILLKAAQLPESPTLAKFGENLTRKLRLGEFNGSNCYCAEIDESVKQWEPQPGLELVSLRKAFEVLPMAWHSVLIKAFAVINWDRYHQFCGRCGHETTPTPEKFERICKNCSLTHYPRISPSIIVLIKKGEELLMARSPHFPAGVYGLIAGFVEVGENIEDTVHREVKEEVGIQIKNLRYFGSQSWPFPDSLMIGFTADYANGELNIDTAEIEDAGWYRFSELPGRPSVKISIAGRMIDAFVTEQIAKSKKNIN